MKFIKYTVSFFLIVIIALYVFVPDRLTRKYRKQSVKSVAEQLDVNPKVANFLVNTGLGRKVVYVFAKKKANKEIEKAMISEKETVK